jgi:hypothetical protein
MYLRSGLIVACLWIASLFAVASIATAQLRGTTPVPPRIISGPDIGFRIEGQQGNIPVGKFVVRIDGQWVEAQLGSANPKPTPAVAQ